MGRNITHRIAQMGKVLLISKSEADDSIEELTLIGCRVGEGGPRLPGMCFWRNGPEERRLGASMGEKGSFPDRVGLSGIENKGFGETIGHGQLNKGGDAQSSRRGGPERWKAKYRQTVICR